MIDTIPGSSKQKKWESGLTIDRTAWGWNRNSTYFQYMTARELIHQLIEIVAFNGNLLLNVGPSADGTISPIFVDRLVEMGEWLGVNGDAIYGTRPWPIAQNETASNVFYTSKKGKVYGIFTEWPVDSLLELRFPTPTAQTKVMMLGVEGAGDLEWSRLDTRVGGMKIVLPVMTPNLVPCQHAWVVAISGLESGSHGNGDARLH
mmetsp:Transcript_9059/g.20928  ORF Transcript_9059/g.20928 Transcript_9059/m.20928 type:complete len:204 (+) Transcript_9059:307-918(+)